MMRSGVAVVLLPPCRLGLGRIRQAQFKDTQFQAQFKAFEALTLSRRRAIYLVATGSATLGSPYGATHRSLRSSESHCSGPIIPMSEVEQLRSRWSRLDPRMSPLSSLGVVTDALLSQDTLPEASSIHIDFGFSAPYFDLPFLRSGIPNKSLTPRIQWDFTPGESFTLPPLIKTIECIALDFCPSPRFLFALSLVVTPDPKHPFSIHREIQSSKSIKRPSWTKIQRDQSCWEVLPKERKRNSGLRASTTIGYLTLGESGREGAASRRRHPLVLSGSNSPQSSMVKGSRWGSWLSWSLPTGGRGGELILRCQSARRRAQVEATDALVFPVDSLLPVRACCHAGKSGAFGLFLISKVARGRKMRIQSRRSGRMVEESMDSLGIDSRWLDIRVTTGREEERSTTELLATSCKGKDKTTFRTFLLVQTFE
ncbi:hypothetical protein Tco_0801027 [Tanacetum coccineum]|uniref:Uncharacterized protein n=1 Tax=Tanacetum coccineum TaxID=301880 RepID=A0ABQ4ZUT8_9ASTR